MPEAIAAEWLTQVLCENGATESATVRSFGSQAVGTGKGVA
jgi:hypothetical protein